MNKTWLHPMNRSTGKSTDQLFVDQERLNRLRAKPCPICLAEAGKPCMDGRELVYSAVHVSRAKATR